MLEGIEDTKDWFYEQRLERRVSLIELWRDGESEELEEKTGEHHNDFREMMEQIREEYSSEDMTDRVLQNELEKDGFDSVIALQIIDAMEESSGPRDDLVFLKRNATPTELEKMVEKAVELYMGDISPEKLREFIQSLEETDDEASDQNGTDLTQDLFNRANRFMIASIRISIEETGGLEAIKEETRSSANMSEDQVEAIFSPIESNLNDLQRYHIYYHIKEMKSNVTELGNKVDKIAVTISDIHRILAE